MTTRYQKQHYEDVAEIIKAELARRRERGSPSFGKALTLPTPLVDDFADLFAADNPPSTRCWHCGASEGTMPPCRYPAQEHNYGGFDREQFLAACGLESEG
jgi:hypothetical protein